jgi:hypothetical protein
MPPRERFSALHGSPLHGMRFGRDGGQKAGNGQRRESRFRALVQAEQEVSVAAEGARATPATPSVWPLRPSM